MSELSYYVINLERQPERRARFLELNRHWIDEPGVKIHFFPAYDGHKVDLPELVRRGIFGPSVLDPQVFNKFIAGNVLSQRDLWLKCIQSGKPLVVMEDDAVLNVDAYHVISGFVEEQPDFDIILAGYNFDSNLQLSIVPGVQSFRGEFVQKRLSDGQIEQFTFANLGSVKLFRLGGAFGVPCYLISPKGAQQLLELCFPFEERLHRFESLNRQVYTYTLDIAMNQFYPNLVAYACVPPLAVADNNKKDSSCTGHEANNVNIFMF